MKKVIACIVALLMFLSFPGMIFADSSIALYLNGKKLSGGSTLKVIGGYTYIPMTAVDGTFKVKTSWDGSRKKATIVKDKIKIEMVVDSRKATVNGESANMEAAPRIVGKVTMLPLKFIGVQLGYKVSWDKLTRAVYMFKSGGVSQPDLPDTPNVPVKPPTDGSNTYPPGNGDSTPDPGGSSQNGGLPSVSSIQTTADQVVIQTDGAVQPKSFTLSNPDRIVVDIPNSTINPVLSGGIPASNGEIAVQHPLISKIRYAMFSNNPSTVRVVMDVKQKVPYNVSANVEANSVVVQLQSDSSSQIPTPGQPSPEPTNKFKVVIDAGHGGHDPGAVSISKIYEEWFNLSLAAKVNELLLKEPVIQPFMTRSDDTFISLDDRANYANNLNADLFVSIHANRVASASVRGTETYYFKADSKAFADVVHRSLINATGFPDRKVRQEDFRVIKATKMPAILLELGYLSNAQDESQMLKDDFQMKEALAIVAGIKQYLQIN